MSMEIQIHVLSLYVLFMKEKQKEEGSIHEAVFKTFIDITGKRISLHL